MVLFPNCKVNFGLHITHKRADGYHAIETVFYPAPFKDALEIITDNSSAEPGHSSIKYSSSGLEVAGNPDDNLVCKAYHLLKKDYASLPSVKIHLHKAIPMGAGLGGGSADGAFALQLLNLKFKLQLSAEQLLKYALMLGSDCPFFIINQPSIGKGRGEILEPINLNLKDYYLVLVNPGIHINTGWAFSQIIPSQPAKNIQTIIAQPIETWQNELVNDFEIPVFAAHPAIGQIKQQLYASGAIYASLTGSGSSVFGLFKHLPSKLTFDSSYKIIQLTV